MIFSSIEISPSRSPIYPSPRIKTGGLDDLLMGGRRCRSDETNISNIYIYIYPIYINVYTKYIIIYQKRLRTILVHRLLCLSFLYFLYLIINLWDRENDPRVLAESLQRHELHVNMAEESMELTLLYSLNL